MHTMCSKGWGIYSEPWLCIGPALCSPKRGANLKGANLKVCSRMCSSVTLH